MSRRIKKLIGRACLHAVSGTWPARDQFSPGYTIVLPVPQDMPFLLRCALEGIAASQSPSCKEVLVVADGAPGDLKHLQAVISQANVPRVRLLSLGTIQRRIANSLPMRDGGANYRHWLTIVIGVGQASTEYVFLHDADAFLIDPDAIERQYATCQRHGFDVLGVTARWDPFFEQIGYRIPGTWESMFSTAWVRRWAPWQLKSTSQLTPWGQQSFDTMLYAQFQNYPSGRVAVMDDPPRFVHFNGTISTYRTFRRCRAQVCDELFRLLLLAVLEDVFSHPGEVRSMPSLAMLRRGLSDASNPIVYSGANAAAEFPIFQRQIQELSKCSVFSQRTMLRIFDALKPFDHMFLGGQSLASMPGASLRKMRLDGLGTPTSTA